MMTSASLCTGYGGLDRAVEAVFGAELVWCSEIDAAACRVIDARFPNVPNLGYLRGIDVPPDVDILTAGFPCQPVSSAGRKRGVNDERWLFDDICGLLGRMGTRPRLCVFENVVGLLTANGGDAMARVVHGLAGLGYVGRVRGVRACDVGACHQRARVFIVATDPERDVAELRREPCAVLGAGGADEGTSSQRQRGGDAARDSGATIAYGDGAGRGDAVADSAGGQRDVRRPSSSSSSTRISERIPVDVRGSDCIDFGQFTDAVARWERIIGRYAPSPAVDRRLNPRFVEWMMGLPDGWVCDVLTKRTEALRCLGNGVVPQQAEHAIRALL